MNRIFLKKGKTNKFYLTTIFGSKVTPDLLYIEDKKFDIGKKEWQIPATIVNAPFVFDLLEKHLFLSIDPDALDLLESLINDYENFIVTKQKNFIDSQKYDTDFEVNNLKKELRNYQKVGVEFGTRNKRVIFGDEMGLGKTIQALGVVMHNNALPCLIVCPNTLKYNWKREISVWTDKKAYVFDRHERLIDQNADFCIISYNSLEAFKGQIEKYNFVSLIGDESHYLKNQKSGRTQNFAKLSVNIEYILLLTGTAIINRPNELISQLNILGKLDHFGGWWSFAKRYCDAKRTSFGIQANGATNLEELHNKLREICYVRRNKEDVLKELPQKQRNITEIELENSVEYMHAELEFKEWAMAAYKIKLRESVKQWMKDRVKKSEIERRKQEFLNEYEWKLDNVEALMKITALRKLSAKGKITESVEWIKDFLESGNKLVVFAIHTEIIEYISKHFKCHKINGSVDPAIRQQYVEDFQTNPKTNLIIINMKSGAEGITLTAAADVAILELPWEPGTLLQCEDRVHRMGQFKTVNIHYLLARDSYDMQIYELLISKFAIINAVNSGKEIDFKSQSILKDLIKQIVV